MRTIVHVDMDAFFAAVECLDHPELIGKPLVVGGERDSKRGVVSTCSYEARRFGIRSAMPIKTAVRLCPDAIFIRPRIERYREVSRHLHELFDEFSPVKEPLSIDEAFLDMTGCEHFYSSLEAMGHVIKDRIRSALQLTASVGIAPNKFLAKLGSDLRKPDGLVVVRPGDVDDFLVDLPVSRLWGVGKRTHEVLSDMGLHTIGDLRRQSRSWLKTSFGKNGEHLYMLVRGIDNRPVEPPSQEKSMGHETTFEEDLPPEKGAKILANLAATVGFRLRSKGLVARTVTLKIRYGDFTTLTRSHTHPQAFDDDDTLYRTGYMLLDRVAKRPYRLLGLYASSLGDARQLSLFVGDSHHKVTEVMDRLNSRFNKRIIGKGREL